MAVSFKEFNAFVNFIAEAKYPIMIRGRHGIGKSELVYQYANKKKLPVVERRASQMTEGDLVGLPIVKGDSTSWNPPDWFKQACSEAVVLFLDEIDRATTEVRQGIFELTDSRKLNGHRLHPDTIIFAAVNGGVHASQYQVNDMDPAELDRWTVFDVEPTVEDWLAYASQDERINPIIVDFIRHNHSHLEHSKDFEPGKIYPSRRSWERLSRTLNSHRLLEGDFKPNLGTVFNIASGFVGFESAVKLKDHAERYENMVTPEDIFAGNIDKVKGFKINDHVTLVEKMLASGKLSGETPDDVVQNVGRYFLKLPSEAAMKFYTGLSGKKHLTDFLLKIHNATVDGQSLKAAMTAMLRPKK